MVTNDMGTSCFPSMKYMRCYSSETTSYAWREEFYIILEVLTNQEYEKQLYKTLRKKLKRLTNGMKCIYPVKKIELRARSNL